MEPDDDAQQSLPARERDEAAASAQGEDSKSPDAAAEVFEDGATNVEPLATARSPPSAREVEAVSPETLTTPDLGLDLGENVDLKVEQDPDVGGDPDVDGNLNLDLDLGNMGLDDGAERPELHTAPSPDQRNATVSVSVVEFHVREGPSIQEVFPEGLEAFDAEPGVGEMQQKASGMSRSRSKSDLAGLSSSSLSSTANSLPAERQSNLSASSSSGFVSSTPLLPVHDPVAGGDGRPVSPASRRRAVTIKLEQNFRSKLAFLALPDRADAQDQGFSYFLLRQAPALVAGVSCFRQVESDEAVRNKHQRALVVLCNLPLFDYVRSLMETHADDILWADSSQTRLARMRGLHAKLLSLLRPSLCRQPRAIQGPATLLTSLRALGGSRPALALLKCLLLGNTGVMVTGPAGALVSQIVLSISGTLPRRGGMLGSFVGEDMRHSSRCRELAELAVAVLPPRLQGYAASKQKRFKSKLLLMPYCSLMEMDDLREVYTPRVTSKAGKASDLQGRCGYFAGTTNPVMASTVRNGLGDLIIELDDAVLETMKPRWQAQQSPPNADDPTMTNDALPSSSSSSSSLPSPEKSSGALPALQSFERFSSRAARFMREKTDEVVTKLQQLNKPTVRTISLTPAGRVAADLGGKDRAFVRKIDRLLFAREGRKRVHSGKLHSHSRTANSHGTQQSSKAASSPGQGNGPTSTVASAKPTLQGASMTPMPTVSSPPSPSSKQGSVTASFSSFLNSFTQMVEPDAQRASTAPAPSSQVDDHLAYRALDDGGESQSTGGDGEVSVATNEEDTEEPEPIDGGHFSDEEIEVKVQELFVSWMNSLFAEISHYIDYGSLPNAPPGAIQGLHPSHNQDYLREWARRTQTTREKNTCSEVVQFENGDEYRGEILISDVDGFIDLNLERRSGRSRSLPQTEEDNASTHSSELRVERQGRGVYTSPRSGWRYEGAWESDMRHGSGVAMLGDDYLFDGAWEHNKRNGRGTCIVKGHGQVSGIWDADVLRQGIYFDPEGNKIDGVFDDEGFVEEGFYTDASGKTTYKGRFSKEGKPHGVGNATYGDETKYSGTFSEGERHGQGAWSVSPSEWYFGSWKQDVFHGAGILAFTLDGRDVELETEWTLGDLEADQLCCVRDVKTREPIFEGALGKWPGRDKVPSRMPPGLGLVPRYSPEAFACKLYPLPSSEGKVLTSLPSDTEYETESE
ncbi:Phosphatidylinositol 4-phosphate 5-kinase 1 [Hondaea fermentalgiana]|uniref:Phosphatidylinositol 4-phosphate 5-kinase 1 n=1 Tax=Hondaea fermentalgiana TaxID=2315210 RepID=A0A2R5GAH0_9STRA|nr:Phosphatidylinositol 4-phosphate 5-kinase 1 [Hondaea fermentalgiana]|eukprot:GBG28007.1 Phosphatidylinositol 4-phosphate 5-kinase 1 [Hondaea fermentalgiana]